MKFSFQDKITLLAVVALAQIGFAQKKEDNIGSEVVNVVKPYTPTISDAYKIPEKPVLNDEGNSKKENVNYSIFSFPVASTFTPSKGKAEGVEKTRQEHLYDNYATLGLGNYGTLNAELFVNKELRNNDYIGGMFRHLSSQGGIKNIDLDDKYYDTALNVFYGANTKTLSWNIDLGYQNQLYNWYGLPADFGSTLSAADRSTLINGIDSDHGYNKFSIGTKFKFNEGVFDEATVKYNHFTDTYGSAENRFAIKPSVRIPVLDELVKTDVIVDYVGGSFDNNYTNTNTEAVKYGFTNIGLAPSFVVVKDDWTLNLGAAVFYSIDSENNDNNFYVYPQVTASYNVVGDLMIFYAGAEGTLNQNSYGEFVDQNKFLSPTLAINPTDKQYDIHAGLKGKLINNVSYNLRASYVNERNKALFRSNDYSESSSNENYAYGNAMQVVYDDMQTLSISGDLKAHFTDNVSFGINGTFSTYSNDFQQEAWNLPTVKVNSFIDFTITPKWYAGASVYFVGDRKDYQSTTTLFNSDAIVTLDSYFDVNAHVGYKYNTQLTAFLKANNITNQAYQKWLNTPVQGFQIMAGANYKFDF